MRFKPPIGTCSQLLRNDDKTNNVNPCPVSFADFGGVLTAMMLVVLWNIDFVVPRSCMKNTRSPHALY